MVRLEGYFQILGIPYANCNMYTAPLLAHKYFAEKVVGAFSDVINVAKSIMLIRSQNNELDEIVEKLNFPLIVKPANSTDSYGVSLVGFLFT
jgi:D-alanine-D-alanine ligase